MRGVGFDYSNTCPKIDKAIESAKGEIENFMVDLLIEACPLLPESIVDSLSKDYASYLYSRIEDAFEVARKSNEDMRSEADKQITKLQDEISELESEIRELNERCDS